MAKNIIEVSTYPEVSWSNLLRMIPTEQLEDELKRRSQEGVEEALPSGD